ncbi:MAG: sulfotransferase [Deltaproteobacteria bacterium]|nr:sulfotransferase [Deltaproteobacteria bacterium]
MFLWWKNRRTVKEQAAFLAALQPVLIMGRGHSGTRVLSYACTHLGIQLGTTSATGDADDRTFTRTIKKIACRNLAPRDHDSVDGKDLIRFQDAVFRYYTKIGSPQTPWGWKFPETYLIGAWVERTFPQARYIHMVRDGRDLAFKRHLTDDPSRQLGKKLLTHINAMGLPHHLQAALSWAFQVDRFDAFCAGLPDERVFYLRFEDLCLQPLALMQRLCDFLHIPMTGSCERYLARQLEAGKLAQYKSGDPAKIQEIEQAISATLKRHGYL